MRKPDAHSDLLAKLTAFEAANQVKRGPTCTACRLPRPLRDLMVAGRQRGSTFRAISAVIAAEGHKASGYVLARHLRDGHEG